MSDLRKIMAKGRSAQKKKSEKDFIACQLPEDPYEPALSSKFCYPSPVGVVYDPVMELHENSWDSDHIETPERLREIIKRLKESRLYERAVEIPARDATEDELLEFHEKSLIETIKSSANLEDPYELMELSSKFDDIYLNGHSYQAALSAAGSGLALVESLWNSSGSGIALTRPPGHHAMKSEANGYCIFNNAGLAAKALLKKGLKRILIVDTDVHHGQGIQREFIDDSRVLYFSIHRYDYGKFWPNLKESNFDEVGHGDAKGYNINIPLNSPDMGDPEYLAILHRVLLPLAYEFRPEAVLLCAGYDAAIGCPEGQLNVSPAFYGHLVQALKSLAMGKLLVFLEGGYFIDSLVESVVATMRALLGDPCVPLKRNSWLVTQSCSDSVFNLYTVLHPYWNQLSFVEKYDAKSESDQKDNFTPDFSFESTDISPAVPEGLIDCGGYFKHSEEKRMHFVEAVKNEISANRSHWNVSSSEVVYVYDDHMMNHFNVEESDHPEVPERIKRIYDTLAEFDLLNKMTRLPTQRRITREEIKMIHDEDHLDDLDKLREMKSQEELNSFSDEFDSIYFNTSSHDCSLFAAGAFLDLVDSVLTAKEKTVRSGLAITRPPGHHAEVNEFMGFCLLNNVALGANYAKEKYGLKRVLILDWDIHHGNGIQNAFYEDPSVLYISVHRYDGGSFFPGKNQHGAELVGKGPGVGFNVNIPWDGPGMGDPEYSAVFFQIILPIAYEYQPELVLISAGFDAAINDPLGHCKVSPQMFGHMTHHLLRLAGGRVILALEGGYNLTSISLSMTMCAKALLGHPIPMPNITKAVRTKGLETVRNVIKIQENYWSCMKSFSRRIPNINFDDLTTQMKQLSLATESFSSPLKRLNCKNISNDYVPLEYGFQCSTSFVNTLSSSPSSIHSSTLCSSSNKN